MILKILDTFFVDKSVVTFMSPLSDAAFTRKFGYPFNFWSMN